jgi:hypothetical protein
MGCALLAVRNHPLRELKHAVFVRINNLVTSKKDIMQTLNFIVLHVLKQHTSAREREGVKVVAVISTLTQIVGIKPV